MASFVVAVRYIPRGPWSVVPDSEHDGKVPRQRRAALNILQRFRENGLPARRFSTGKVRKTPEGYVVPRGAHAVPER